MRQSASSPLTREGHGHFLAVTVYYLYKRCHVGTGGGYTGPICIISDNCTGIYNYLKQFFFFKGNGTVFSMVGNFKHA